MAISLMAVLGGVAVSLGIGQAFPPLANILKQSSYRVFPNELIPLVEAIEARYRGIMTPDEFEVEVKKQGFDDERREWLYQLSEKLLTIMELIHLHRRGIITEADLITEADKLKWSSERVQQLLTVTEVIPGVQDIISFAVREVYSPEIAEAFGQYEGLDGVYEKAQTDILAIGMAKETFGKFWAAHWMLPSVGQGFEMLHRRVIPEISTPGEPMGLDRLMTALDIMPAWRDKLTAISYSPYTRVDVRRMHKLGIILDEGLLDAYMDLGYDEEKAQGMADFTIAYNADPEDSDLTEKDKNKIREKDLTKTDLLTGYRDGLLESPEVLTSLTAIGYDSDEAAYYISRIDHNQEKDETDQYLKYYGDAYVKGVLDHNQVSDKLAGLNLSGKRISYLFKVWDIERMSRVNKPTKAELMTFLRKKIIDKPTFIEEMKGLNYTERYIDWYLRTI